MHLRPMEESDLETCRRVDTDPSLTRPFEWPGFHDHREHQRRWEEDGFLGAHSSRLAIANPDGSCAGFVNWWAADTMAPQAAVSSSGFSYCPNTGEREGAQRLSGNSPTTCSQLLWLIRLQARTEVENAAERRALEKAGFKFEGILRGGSFVEGVWRDDAIYSRLREDQPPPIE